MMKKHLILICLLPLIQLACGQIVNGSFENWESINNYETPSGWDSNQDEYSVRIVKDTLSYDGNYALKMVLGGPVWSEGDCASVLRGHFSLGYGATQSLSISFKYRSESANQTGNTYLNVRIAEYSEGNIINVTIWENTIQSLDFTEVELPIENSNVDSILILVLGAGRTRPNDGCNLESIIWLDDFIVKGAVDLDNDGFNSIFDCDDTNSEVNPNATEIPNNGIDDDCNGKDATHELANLTLNIYPNPAIDFITIDLTGNLDYTVKLYSAIGQIVFSQINAKYVQVSEIPQGLYIIEISDQNTRQKVIQRVVVAR